MARDESTGRLPWPRGWTVQAEVGAALARARRDRALERSCSFGSGERPVDLTDDNGRLLSLSKWGRLNQSFADLDHALARPGTSTGRTRC